MSLRWIPVGLIAVCGLVLGFAGGERESVDSHIAEYERLTADRSDAVVTIRFVLKTMASDDEDEEDAETTGVMIDPSGLVLCANSSLGESQGEGPHVTATDLKVLIGEDHEGLGASLIARDKELDLAWVRIRKADGKTFKSMDLNRAATVRPGQRLLTIHRLGKYFDRAPEILEGRVAAVLTKPRDLLAPGSGLSGAVGEPVFTEDGGLVGFFVLQMPESSEAQGDQAMNDEGFEVMILPASAAAKATEKAKQMAPAGGDAKSDSGKTKRVDATWDRSGPRAG